MQVAPGQSAEQAALSEAGSLVNPGPFDSYEEANDPLGEFEESDEREEIIS